MFSALRAGCTPRNLTRAFSTTPICGRDMAKLTLIGNLVRDPETRLTKNDKEYMVYTIVTRGPALPADANGERPPSPPTFHRIISFSEMSNKYLRGMRKGSKVYAETTFELREPETGADPNSPQGQRQIFLKHENIRVLSQPKADTSESPSESSDII